MVLENAKVIALTGNNAFSVKKLLSVEDLTTNYLVYIFPKICRKNVVKPRKLSAKVSEKSLRSSGIRHAQLGKDFPRCRAVALYISMKEPSLSSKLERWLFHVNVLGSSSSQKVHKKISTHLLTLLIIGAILHLEQRKGDQSEEILRKEVSF